jgi:site-specific DNA-methyltransferase (adenine-specific)
MKAMPDNFIDSIVTDPPYELGFMGKSWDSTGIAFNVEVWTEALRVLKPGGHLIAFSGSRTYHRMAVAIEDAGFEIRDQIMWVYGSGFPKSMDIGKAIQKASGVQPVGFKENENAAFYGTGSGGQYNPTPRQLFMPPLEGDAANWQGWGTALKPAHEPMVLGRKPVVGTIANNVLTYGVGGLNIDESRVEGKLEGDPNRFAKTDGGSFNAFSKEAPVVRQDGRWPANFIHDGSDEVVALFPDTGKSTGGRIGKKSMGDVTNVPAGQYEAGDPGYGDSGSAARFFYCAKTSKRDRNEGLDDSYAKQMDESRKAGSKRGNNPRNRGANERVNHHPTVKPTSLMQYLVRLVTPPGGTVLDPFMGSGSTGKACVYEGFNFIGIDQSAEYVEIACARIDFALSHKEEMLDVDI